MRIPAPSPRGTNYERLFLVRHRPLAAYDEQSDKLGTLLNDLHLLVAESLNPDQMARFERMIEQLLEANAPMSNDAEPLEEFRRFLKAKGLRDADIERACAIVAASMNGDDLPGNALAGLKIARSPSPAMDAARLDEINKIAPGLARIKFAS